MSEDLKIRIGTPADIDGMMELAMMATDENSFVDPDPAKLLNDMWPALNNDHGLVGIIGEPGKQIEAAILLRTGKMWYSYKDVLEEKAIFVHPEYRSAKGGRAGKLCDFAKDVADSLGVPLIIGVLSNNRTEAKVRLYKRKFGEPAGAFFLYGAKTRLSKGSS
jgi:GNAT superfamily N-acetyltransferase